MTTDPTRLDALERALSRLTLELAEARRELAALLRRGAVVEVEVTGSGGNDLLPGSLWARDRGSCRAPGGRGG